MNILGIEPSCDETGIAIYNTEKQSIISCYGDSFTFCRQVNDDETWEHYLSKKLKTNVKNFAV